MTGLILFVHIVFFVYFGMIGLRRLGLIPLGIVLGAMLHYGSQQWGSVDLKNMFHYSGTTLAWVIILCGMMGVMQSLGISRVYILSILIVLNVTGWLGSYLAQYNDGKQIFHMGYRFTFLIGIVMFVFNGLIGYVGQFILIWIHLSLVLYTFIVLVIGNFFTVERSMTYLMLLFVNVFVVAVIIRSNVSYPYLGMFLSLLYLALIYRAIYSVDRLDIDNTKLFKKRDKIEYILQGGKLSEMEEYRPPERIAELKTFLQAIPPILKNVLSSLNVFLVVGLLITFLQAFGNSMLPRYYILLYWGGLSLFLINFWLLQQLHYPLFFQRLLVFIVLNFAIYITLGNLFGHSISHVIVFGVVWNFINTFAILLCVTEWKPQVFDTNDYMYWIITTGCAMIVNSFFITKLPLAGNIIFSLIFLYRGVQLFLMLYNIKYLRMRQQESDY